MNAENGRAILDNNTVNEPIEGNDVTTVSSNVSNIFESLALLSFVEYDQRRKSEAKALGIRVGTLDREVELARKVVNEQDSTNSLFSVTEPWPDRVDGNHLLLELQSVFKQYSIIPDGAEIALPLWVLGTYVFDIFRIYPMLGLVSPEKRCGKSTVMTILKAISQRSILASNISRAAVYRVIEAWRPTLLIDEADTFLKGNDELRGIINSGHTKDAAFVIRTEGDNHEPKKFSTWAPKAIAMIGDMPDTNRDRSIVLTMRRRKPGERINKIALGFGENCESLRQKCLRWAMDNQLNLGNACTVVPDIGNDRASDNWTSLLTIAEVIGGDWMKEAIKAMKILSEYDEGDNIGPMLLNDIKTIFEDKNVEQIFSEDLVKTLIELEERPWGEWSKGKPISTNKLSRLLKPYKIRTQTIRFNLETKKGYKLKSFDDVFSRYLSTEPQNIEHSNVTPSQVNCEAGIKDNQNDTPNENVTDHNDTYHNDVTDENMLRPNNGKDCDGVTDENTTSGTCEKNISKPDRRVEI
ncbi:MAG TPA: DUF3631 domain-containing protein [Thiotrichaceae bacterium]|jgi:putative DNA primase/helicase|nr:DUF3631 domain-containing protein [Thiotrichaceae bacterium]